MANLEVKDIDDHLYNSIKVLASHDRRSISQEVIFILQKYLSKPQEFDSNPTDEFLKLVGSWKDERSSEEIINEIRSNRSNSSRLGRNNELFD